ncbi:hypothetical protein V5F59_06535 [Xanthobacter autotrophicus DSM 431]|uniref:DUF6867 family protein n=1 Tax=Xanthobacter nonsaccharivorans TaxID=3119912 RepID=UPI00372B5A14
MDRSADPGRPSSPMLWGPLVALAVLAVSLFVRPDLLIGRSAADFIIVTVVLGGGAAWLTGKAVARSWEPYSYLVVYGLLLAAAVRFCHFALFEDTLFALKQTVPEFALLFSIATLGFRAMRRRQMTRQYGWLYEPSGRMSWKASAGTER